MAHALAFEFLVHNTTYNQLISSLYKDLEQRFEVFQLPRILICVFYGGEQVSVYIEGVAGTKNFRISPRYSTHFSKRYDEAMLLLMIAETVFCSLERRGFQVEYVGGTVVWKN